MSGIRNLAGFTLLAVAATLASASARQSESRAPATAVLTVEQMEAFLLKAKIVRMRPTGVGVTNSQRVTLTDGELTHDAHVQVIDEYKSSFSTPQYSEVGFRDTYRDNVAPYRLALLLALDNVPVSVLRDTRLGRGSFTWWVDDVMMDETERRKRGVDDPDIARRNHYTQRMRVFDELIQNRDRNQGNILFTSEWKMWLIDHTRAFRLMRQLLNPAVLTRIERPLFERLQGLTPEALTKALDPHLGRSGREDLLARRNLLVAHFRARIAELGEDRVLYTFDR